MLYLSNVKSCGSDNNGAIGEGWCGVRHTQLRRRHTPLLVQFAGLEVRKRVVHERLRLQPQLVRVGVVLHSAGDLVFAHVDQLLDLILLVGREERALARVLLELRGSRVSIGALGAQGGGLVSATLSVCRNDEDRIG